MIPARTTSGTCAAGVARAVVALVACLAGGAAVMAADLTGPTPAPVPDAAMPSDPLAGSPWIDPATTGPDAENRVESMLPPRSDSPADWVAAPEPLHHCGEPRLLPPCVPPPPCHPALPPRPLDLVGVHGMPTCGPRYGGPCAPRTGSHDDGTLPRLHRVPDRFFDWFYRSR